MPTSLTLNGGVRRFAEVSTYPRGSEIGKRTPLHTVNNSPSMYIKYLQTYIGHAPLGGH
jgi:hypothetical protein